MAPVDHSLEGGPHVAGVWETLLALETRDRTSVSELLVQGTGLEVSGICTPT